MGTAVDENIQFIIEQGRQQVVAEAKKAFIRFRMMLNPRTIEEDFGPATDYRLELMQA